MRKRICDFEKDCLDNTRQFFSLANYYYFSHKSKTEVKTEMDNEELRKQVKLLKAFQNISYQRIAEYLEIKRSSFYSWLKGQYDLGNAKQRKLSEIITSLQQEV